MLVRQHQLRVLRDVHAPVRACCSAGSWRSSSRPTGSAACPATARASRSTSRAPSGLVIVVALVPRVHVPGARHRARRPVGVPRRLPPRRPGDACSSSPPRCIPRPMSGGCSAAGRCGGSGCGPTASTSGTTRSSASPGRASTSSTSSTCMAGPCSLLRLVLTFAAAELSYRFVETPIRNGATRPVPRPARSPRTASASGCSCGAASWSSSVVDRCSRSCCGMGLATRNRKPTSSVPTERGEQPNADALVGVARAAATTTTRRRRDEHHGRRAQHPARSRSDRRATTTTTTAGRHRRAACSRSATRSCAARCAALVEHDPGHRGRRGDQPAVR